VHLLKPINRAASSNKRRPPVRRPVQLMPESLSAALGIVAGAGTIGRTMALLRVPPDGESYRMPCRAEVSYGSMWHRSESVRWRT